jgi:L-serine/L-threonine ammonia-lyase
MTELHINTPLIESLAMSKVKDSKIWLKMETMQPCGSFKARGIGYACQKHIANGARALISSSGGNAGLAVAYSGRRLGIPVTVVVPKSTTKRAIELIKLEGASVIITGDDWNAAHKYALSLVKNEVAYIHPFDDPNVWKGHSSIIDEISIAGIVPDVVVLSVGGGGLLCGVVEGLKRNHLEEVPILAVETQGAESLYTAYMANEHIGIDKISSIATSLGATKVSKRAFELLNEYQIFCHVVTDAEAINGCCRFLDDHRTMVEPACGASLSAVYNFCNFLKDKQSIVVIVCGGVGVTMGQLKKWVHEIR